MIALALTWPTIHAAAWDRTLAAASDADPPPAGAAALRSTPVNPSTAPVASARTRARMASPQRRAAGRRGGKPMAPSRRDADSLAVVTRTRAHEGSSPTPTTPQALVGLRSSEPAEHTSWPVSTGMTKLVTVWPIKSGC